MSIGYAYLELPASIVPQILTRAVGWGGGILDLDLDLDSPSEEVRGFKYLQCASEPNSQCRIDLLLSNSRLRRRR